MFHADTAALLHRLAAACLAVQIVGCAAPYDPSPPADEPLRVLRFRSPENLEATYRTLYARLEECAGASYRVQPRFDRAAGHAWLMLVAGLGLDRYSALGNRFAARFDVRETPDGTRVEAPQVDRGLVPVVDAAPAWLNEGSRDCRA